MLRHFAIVTLITVLPVYAAAQSGTATSTPAPGPTATANCSGPERAVHPPAPGTLGNPGTGTGAGGNGEPLGSMNGPSDAPLHEGKATSDCRKQHKTKRNAAKGGTQPETTPSVTPSP